jgi:hypothetical protein
VDEWGKGYCTGVILYAVTLICILRPDYLSNILRAGADWLDSKPRYEIRVIKNDIRSA